MCPEPDFGLCYHRLMEYYRPSTEVSSRQLSGILERYFTQKAENDKRIRRKPEKGGIPV